MENIKAVLFDLDGTLIDTEKYYRACWKKAFESFGYNVSDEQVLTLRSLGRPFAPDHIKKLIGDENADYKAIRELRSSLMEEMIKKEGIELKKGAEKLLEYLKSKEIITAVSTASDLERTTRYLKQVRIYDYFDKLISCTMVKFGKPAPDVYVYACKELGLNPSECVAVEDSPNGVKSAFDAGCKVIMVPDQTKPDEDTERMLWKKAESLDKIIDIFENV